MGNITNDLVNNYICSLYHPLDEEMRKYREYAEKDQIPIILKEAETLILNLIRLKQPKRILEIGAAVGYSSSCFAKVSNADIVTIESDDMTFVEATHNIKRIGLDKRIKVLYGDAREVLEEMQPEEPFDFVFIDAAKSHYMTFWDKALEMVTNDALIVSDNVLLKGGTADDSLSPYRRFRTNITRMRDYLEYITNLDWVDTSVIPVGDGIAISLLKGKNE